MLSDSIRELRKQTLDAAHGGLVMSGEDMVALAAKLLTFETFAANLERQVGQRHFDARFAAIVAARPAKFGRRGIAR